MHPILALSDGGIICLTVFVVCALAAILVACNPSGSDEEVAIELDVEAEYQKALAKARADAENLYADVKSDLHLAHADFADEGNPHHDTAEPAPVVTQPTLTEVSVAHHDDAPTVQVDSAAQAITVTTAAATVAPSEAPPAAALAPDAAAV